MGRMRKSAFAAAAAAWIGVSCSFAAAAVQEKEWGELNERPASERSREALAAPGPWRHAESAHFTYHYTDPRAAAAVVDGAEAAYEWVRQALGVDETETERPQPKAHLVIFEDERAWRAFAASRAPGENADAFTDGRELYLWRNPAWLEPKKTLAHEITHLVVMRWSGGAVPLFLHEGLADFIGYRALASRLGVSEYDFRYVAPISEADWIDLDELVEMREYPRARTDVFYRQSEWIVRFLVFKHDRGLLYRLLRLVASGGDFRRSVRDVYGYEWEDFSARVAAYAQRSG